MTRSARRAALGVALAAAGAAVQAGTCDLMRAGLTEAQAAKYHLSRQDCAAPGTPEPGPEAPAAAPRARPREAGQLRLYELPPVDVAPVVPQAMPDGRATEPVPRRLPPSVLRALQLSPEVDAAALRHRIDPLLLHAIAWVESRHNADAVSRAGARGLMQVMPATGRRFGVADAGALNDARTNLDVSAAYLKTLQGRFGNDLALVLAAYNAGEGAVERHGRRVPPFPETQQYVQDVLARYGELTAAARKLAGAGSRQVEG